MSFMIGCLGQDLFTLTISNNISLVCMCILILAWKAEKLSGRNLKVQCFQVTNTVWLR